MITRRGVLGLPLAAGVQLAGCTRSTSEPSFTGAWVGAQVNRGHAWRDGKLPVADAGTARRVTVAIVGAGVAGLSAARALRMAGVDDHVVFDLEDQAGGNARGHVLAGQPCPLGAHYLPVPPPSNEPLVAWLHELGLARTVNGRIVYDERHLCHSPQERLFTGSAWQEGLLPVLGESPQTLDEMRRLAAELSALARTLSFSVPTQLSKWTSGHAALDAQTFAQWLDASGYQAAALRWYLDYCCRDDYGAGAAQVSAWAGIQYFVSRHGLQAPHETGQGQPREDREQVDAVLTWPEGNAFLTRALAKPLGDRMHTASVVTRVEPGRHDVGLQVWNAQTQTAQRWTAQHVIMAVPLFIAARLLKAPPPALQGITPQLHYAPWLVSNLLLKEPLLPRQGAPSAWDNVLRNSPALGYVDARHQSLRADTQQADLQVLTHYWALGGNSAVELNAQRQQLLGGTWQQWANAVLADLVTAHPDLPHKLQHIDLMRYGHAMCIPMPGLRSHAALRALSQPQGRLSFAHADLSGYSVFEEAFSHGLRAGRGAVH